MFYFHSLLVYEGDGLFRKEFYNIQELHQFIGIHHPENNKVLMKSVFLNVVQHNMEDDNFPMLFSYI